MTDQSNTTRSKMDLIYGKRASEKEEDTFNKRAKTTDALDLPMHLPNDTTPLPLRNTTPSTTTSATGEHMGKKAPMPIPGTSITLETKTDIDEWIKQRKANWLKKISNNKIERKDGVMDVDKRDGKNDGDENEKDTTQQRSMRPNDRYDRRGQANNHANSHLNNRRKGPQGNTHPQDRRDKKFNLNKTIIQRGLSTENAQILAVIKELFARGVLGAPGA